MKKLLVACLCLGLTLNLSGCAIGDLVDKFANIHNTEDTADSEPKTRVYMDELKGTLLDFSGNTLTIVSDDVTYLFDVSGATLECKSGMISGDEVSIIYEGKLPESGTDTSSVKALKVVNDYHNQHPLKEQTASGTIQNLSSNTITIKDDSGVSATYQTTGCEEFFSEGIHKDMLVFLHYYGTPGEASELSKAVNASHVKVISVSDLNPLDPPGPVEIPKEATNMGQLRTTLQSFNLNTLTVLLSDRSTTLTLDVTEVPCYFQGGAAPGAFLILTYSGKFNGSTTEGITIENIATEAPKKNRALEATVSGLIIANTANTITIQTSDGAIVTCNTEHALNSSTGGMEIGSGIKVTFHPDENKDSNIYTCLKIEDA